MMCCRQGKIIGRISEYFGGVYKLSGGYGPRHTVRAHWEMVTPAIGWNDGPASRRALPPSGAGGGLPRRSSTLTFLTFCNVSGPVLC